MNLEEMLSLKVGDLVWVEHSEYWADPRPAVVLGLPTADTYITTVRFLGDGDICSIRCALTESQAQELRRQRISEMELNDRLVEDYRAKYPTSALGDCVLKGKSGILPQDERVE